MIRLTNKNNRLNKYQKKKISEHPRIIKIKVSTLSEKLKIVYAFESGKCRNQIQIVYVATAGEHTDDDSVENYLITFTDRRDSEDEDDDQ